ncbi:MAG: response regulator [Nitrospirae bacterium]|nr:MAG: response regulator [Nitrospirota bacterium]
MQTKPATVHPNSSLQPGTILLVEDDKGVRDLARTVLLQRGYTVLFAGDGDKALKVAQFHVGPIDLLVTDVVMPGLSGPQLAERMRALRPHLRVLFISGMVHEATVKGPALAEGGFLSKPFPGEALIGKVQEILAGSALK